MSSYKKIPVYFFLLFTSALFISCFNPFSPGLDESQSTENIISDQKTIEGVFQNFKYAYTFKDTSIYGGTLSPDFVFSYFDYDLGVEVSWDRATDMRTTEGLFTNTQDLRLIWNNIVFQEGDSLLVDVKRGFNLSISFNPNDVINFYGFVDMNLGRNSVEEKWKIRSWKDMTNP
ncbi:MAG: hypothetical protein ABI543_07165 [Ignavibacteria bacterium]